MTGQPPRGASGSYTGGGQPRHVEAVHEGATQLPALPSGQLGSRPRHPEPARLRGWSGCTALTFSARLSIFCHLQGEGRRVASIMPEGTPRRPPRLCVCGGGKWGAVSEGASAAEKHC